MLFTGVSSVSVIALTPGLNRDHLAWVLAIAAIALAARFFQSMRSRDIPLEFLAPTVIPGGMDLSAVKIMVWLGDGIVVTVTGVLAVMVL